MADLHAAAAASSAGPDDHEALAAHRSDCPEPEGEGGESPTDESPGGGIGGNPIQVIEDDAGNFEREYRRQLTLPGLDGMGEGEAAATNGAGPGHAEEAKGIVEEHPAEPEPEALAHEAAAGGAAGSASSGGASPGVQEWDVAHGPRKEGITGGLGMVLPAVTRAVVGIIGGTLAGTGYVAAKVGEKVIGGKAVDSKAFKAGFISWMWSNGIFPTTRYEPLGVAGDRLRAMYGLPRVPKPSDMAVTPILVCNHISYLDGLVLAAVFGAPRIVAKSGTRQVPVIGKIMEEMDAVFVDRSAHDSRKATLDAILAHCDGWQPGKRPLLIFPEGTTTNGDGLLEFKKGAFASGKPVRPVIIVYTGSFDPASVSYKQTGRGDIKHTTDAEWAAQFMGHFIHSMHVRVLSPYLPTQEESADPAVYARNCREYMARELERVRHELVEKSWKTAAHRSGGGLDYQFGDLTRAAYHKTKDFFTGANRQ